MHKNDDLFDKKVRERLNRENSYVPDDIDKVFNEAIDKVKKKSIINFRKVSGICAACIAGTMILGMTMPTYASNLPIIGSIFEAFHLSKYENFDKYASDLNITKESNGVKVTINKVVYDGFDLDIFYTVESEESMENVPYFVDQIIKVNGKVTSFGSGHVGEFLDGNKVYMGSKSYGVNSNSLVPKELREEYDYGGHLEIPDDFILSLEISKIGDMNEENIIKGDWTFDIPVSNEKVSGKVKEADIDINLSSIYGGANINRITVTPINTIIQGVTNSKTGIKAAFMVFDDKGRYIQNKSGGGSGYGYDEGNYEFYFDYKFKEVYDDTESLTFIPYENALDIEVIKMLQENINNQLTSFEMSAPKLESTLNLQDETILKTEDGNEYSRITKVDISEGKTKISFKSNHGIYAAPIEIVDNNTGEKILPVDNFDYMELETTRYNHETGELVIEFDKELTGDNYSVSYYDQSKTIIIHDKDIFTLEVPK